MDFDIIGFGSIAIDDYLWVSSYPEPDQKALVLEKQRDFGGLVGTAIAAAARLGLKCAYGGIIGNDDLSRALTDEFARYGIDTSHAFITEEGDPVHSIIVAEKTSHTRTIFYTGRKEPELPEERLNSLISGTRAVLVDQSGLTEAEIAREKGVPVIGDLEWMGRDDITRFLQAVDHLILPEVSALALTGSKDADEALSALHTQYPRNATVVTAGERGCRYIEGKTGGAVRIQEAFPVNINQTNGCGDVFHGAYATALIHGKPVPEAIRFASAAAAVYASRNNGWEYLPTLEEVTMLLHAA